MENLPSKEDIFRSWHGEFSKRAKVAGTIFLFIYALSFVRLYNLFGVAAITFIAIPAVIFSWGFGLAGAIFISILSWVLSAFLLNSVGISVAVFLSGLPHVAVIMLLYNILFLTTGFIKLRFEKRFVDKYLATEMTRYTLAHTPLAVYSYNNKGTITHAEGDLLRRMGTTPKEVVGEKVLDLYGDNPQVKKDLKKALAGEDISTELLLDKFYLKVSSRPIRNEKGEVTTVIGVVYDITETKKQAEELTKFKEAVENAHDHIIITDPNAKILYANPAVERVTGYSRDEVIGETPSLWGGKMDDKFYKNMWRTIKEKKITFTGEVKNVRKGGKEYFAEMTISPVVDEDKKLKYFVGVERDITKTKEIEQMKDDFINIAAHDLRTPATAVKGFISMVLGGDVGKITPEVKKTLEEAYEGNERLIELVNTFLNVSRIERGKLHVEVQPEDLTAIVKEAVEGMKHQASDKDLYLEYFPTELPKVYVDKERTIEVLINLLSNAIKFSDKGGITVSHEISEGFVVTHVSDTGMGIDQDQQKLLFQKFQKAGEASDTPGLGMGLYISRLIVEQSGGKIWVESTEGEGSTFSFSLRIVE